MAVSLWKLLSLKQKELLLLQMERGQTERRTRKIRACQRMRSISWIWLKHGTLSADASASGGPSCPRLKVTIPTSLRDLRLVPQFGEGGPDTLLCLFCFVLPLGEVHLRLAELLCRSLLSLVSSVRRPIVCARSRGERVRNALKSLLWLHFYWSDSNTT